METYVQTGRFSLIGAVIVFALTGCVSKSKHERLLVEKEYLQQEKAQLLQDLENLQDEKVILETTLSSRKNQSLASLENDLKACHSRIKEAKDACGDLSKKAQEAGFFQGAAEFNASLQVAGIPRSNGWWVFASHYYEFQVRLRNETLFTFTVETEAEQPPLQQSLALVSELTKVLKYKG